MSRSRRDFEVGRDVPITPSVCGSLGQRALPCGSAAASSRQFIAARAPFRQAQGPEQVEGQPRPTKMGLCPLLLRTRRLVGGLALFLDQLLIVVAEFGNGVIERFAISALEDSGVAVH
jgi:hypothetical protein